MKRFIETDPHELTGNVFRLIGRDWMLVTAGEGTLLQHHDRELGRAGCALERAGEHDLRPPFPLHLRIYRTGAGIFPLLPRAG